MGGGKVLIQGLLKEQGLIIILPNLRVEGVDCRPGSDGPAQCTDKFNSPMIFVANLKRRNHDSWFDKIFDLLFIDGANRLSIFAFCSGYKIAKKLLVLAIVDNIA